MITKAIIPIAGLGTRFLPLSKVLPKELWPVVDQPLIQYIVKEAKISGISEIIFVTRPEKKSILDYFTLSPKLEKILKERKKDHLLKELKNLDQLYKGLSFIQVFQKKPLGDGHAILQARALIGKDPTAVLFPDDLIESETPVLVQLIQIFKTCQKPVIALSKVSRERLSSYGVVEVEKIAARLYKIKKIIEKPPVEKAPSNLAIVGKYILTPEVFDYLKKAKPSPPGEIILAEVLDEMIKDGKIIYGYEFKGKWLECGDKNQWLKTFFYLTLKHPQFGPELKKFLKELKI